MIKKVIIAGLILTAGLSAGMASGGEPHQQVSTSGSAKAGQKQNLSPAVQRARGVSRLLLGELALSREYYREALALYVRQARLSKEDRVFQRAVDVAVMLGNKKVARRLVDDWLQSSPHNIQARLYRIRLLMMAGKFLKAASMLKELPTTAGHRHEIAYLKALILLEQKQDIPALVLLRGLEGTSFHSDAMFLIGQIYEWRKQPGKALEWYQKVNSGDRVVDAGIRRAVIAMQQQHYQQALQLLIRLSPVSRQDITNVLILQADAYLALDHDKMAIQVADQGVDFFPDDVRFYYLRGLAYSGVGKIDKAQQDFRHVLAKQPDNPDALNALGYLLLTGPGAYQQGYKLIKKAYKLNPHSPAILDSMGWALFKLERYQQALTYIKKAYQQARGAQIAAHYAVILSRLGKQTVMHEVLSRHAKQILNNHQALQTLKQYGLENYVTP